MADGSGPELAGEPEREVVRVDAAFILDVVETEDVAVRASEHLSGAGLSFEAIEEIVGPPGRRDVAACVHVLLEVALAEQTLTVRDSRTWRVEHDAQGMEAADYHGEGGAPILSELARHPLQDRDA